VHSLIRANCVWSMDKIGLQEFTPRQGLRWIGAIVRSL
jgi:hypothetical protein